ncbi:Synaptotagmin-9 Synaptotagmin IX [Collichthys lucidus]|uniref:Synaptotagmin-9 Synaptotagmin IX n=1 Tax=Collichthys lucidus TaxID=240159 RepID=A0A4U5U712_COLLU|nr:Synaptotagmin-9 Synaptotagmin IX [Collichthys lucidus]
MTSELLVQRLTAGGRSGSERERTYFSTLDSARHRSGDISVSLLSLVVTACGLALFGVSLFVSWKLCWIPWRERGLSPTTKEAHGHLNPTMSPLPPQPAPRQPVYTAVDPPAHNRRESSHCSIAREPTPMASAVSVEAPVTPVSPPPVVLATPEAAMKISHTSPDIPLDAQSKSRENGVHTNPRMQRQTTEPPPSGHSMSEIGQGSIRRHMNLSNPDFNVAQFQRQDSLTGMGLGLGRLKPELYKQRSLEGDEGSRRGGGCGRLHFILKFDCDLEQLIVKIHKAEDLPAKDFSGTSDPYVKIYLLPDRMTKHQTKVHRKTLNPVFDEVFLFPVAYSELPTRKLHFSVYDFDRFSRHDIIGQVVVDNFLDLADFPRETKLCREIQYVSTDNVDLGDLMFSLCYLPTAGRLTITMIKARNLKAYGYHWCICVGHNEVIGVCRVGNDADNLGRGHWSEMLTYPRKPVAHWHPLVEYQGTTGSSQGGSCNSLKTPPSP